MDGVFKEGEIVKVKLIDIDKKTNKLKLSRKALLPKPERSGDQGESRPEGSKPQRKAPTE